MVALIAIFGFQLLERAQKLLVPTVGLLTLTGVFAFAGDFDPGYAGGDYLLGSFWSTWTLSVVLAVSGPVSYCTSVGDWTRYVSRRHGDRRLAGAVFGGMFLGALVPALLGAFIGVAIGVQADADFITSVVAAAPAWYLVPILLNGLVGSCGQASIALYSTGLDLDADLPAAVARRLHGADDGDLPGARLPRRVRLGRRGGGDRVRAAADGRRDAVDGRDAGRLRARARPLRRGRPAGVQRARQRRPLLVRRRLELARRARLGAGSVVGLLCSSTTIYAGPLAGVAGGVDLSFIAGALTGALAYLAIRAVFPESARRGAARAAPAGRGRVTGTAAARW